MDGGISIGAAIPLSSTELNDLTFTGAAHVENSIAATASLWTAPHELDLAVGEQRVTDR
jgi:hypothetical protein